MDNTCIFTIVAPNYIGQALTLKNSIDAYSSSVDFKIILVSDKKIDLDVLIEPHIIYAKDIQIQGYNKICFSYNILEHCTNIKPACFKYLINSYEFVHYIDPDIFFYQSPSLLNNLFYDKDVLITPHILSPILDDYKPSELEFLRTGIYNLGFIGLRRSLNADIFLKWWAERCEKYGINQTSSGLFVDQKWIDIAPCFFEFIQISRHRGLNVGYWNLHERNIYKQDGEYYSSGDQLIMFHFSGLNPNDFQHVSKHQSRLFIDDSMELYHIFKSYSNSLILNSNNNIFYDIIPYCSFDNGLIISELARKFHLKNSFKYNCTELFSNKSQLYIDCKRKKLLTNVILKTGDYGSQSNLKKFSFQIRLIEVFLNIFKSILGPVRIYLLRKYLIQRFSILSDYYLW